MSHGYHGNRHIFPHSDTGLYQHVVKAYRISVFFTYENEKFYHTQQVGHFYGSKLKPYNNMYTLFDKFLR